ncbi:MAG: response regulator receiver modulated diguanylate cyclase/phosphodiesterase with sensor(s), partial [Acidobacteria bacterium]|nr:response regulator receiver modulated diguanylate cyclase/phosphodiesterase with sensor(s) [Acidobacteriota bacterium]
MNVLFVTAHIRDADFIEHELRKITTTIHIDFSPRIDDAMTRLAVAGRYDAVLLDPVLPGGGEDLGLIACLREQDLPLPVIVLVGAAVKETPLKVLEAGADDYLVKKPNFLQLLPSVLQRAVERRRAEAERRIHPLQVLFAGDPERAGQFFSLQSKVKIQRAVVDRDGTCHL